MHWNRLTTKYRFYWFDIVFKEIPMSVEITPKGSYGATIPNFPRPLMKVVFGMMNTFIKLQGGHILTLTTTGAKSGKEHSVSLGWFPDGENAWLIVGSNSGEAQHPAWLFNLARNPDKVWIQVNGRKIQVQPESLQGAAYDKAWKQIVAKASNYAGYTTKTDRRIPVIRLTPK
jgi:deazaflavin-dependent oxidoreductase (nitroreductase family)